VICYHLSWSPGHDLSKQSEQGNTLPPFSPSDLQPFSPLALQPFSPLACQTFSMSALQPFSPSACQPFSLSALQFIPWTPRIPWILRIPRILRICLNFSKEKSCGNLLKIHHFDQDFMINKILIIFIIS
jgi:hypothetical protein